MIEKVKDILFLEGSDPYRVGVCRIIYKAFQDRTMG